MNTSQLARALLLGILLLVPASAVLSQANPPGLETARNHLNQNRAALGLTQADIDSLVVKDQFVSQPTGVNYLYLQQEIEGVPVYGAIINVAIAADGRVAHVGNRGVRGARNKAGGSIPFLTARQAVEAASRAVGVKEFDPAYVDKDFSAQLMYVPTQRDGLRLAWMTTIETPDGLHMWYVGVDAATGAELIRQDLVVNDTWDRGASPFSSESKAAVLRFATSSAAKVGSGYRVYPIPQESPSHAGDPLVDLRSFESNPADPIASPLGWHDTGATAYTVTRGNNAHAYTDLDANNVPDPGSDPDGGAGLVFDFPLDLSQQPATYRPAAVTNLFYWNNVIHDVMYQYGFDEAAGNFQVNNFGNGGLGNDDVRAEAQDGSGTNNANFGTPPDGSRPRMQMFVWSFNLPNELVVGAPVSQTFQMSGAAFGPAFDATGITGTIELVNDAGGASITDGCEPLVGFAAGNIALIDRGSCNFTVKVANAQVAGATAVVIANNVAGSAVTLGGSDPTITIPSGMITLDDGNTVKVGLPATATARAGANAVSRDSDFDNGVIVHEYGHGISNRLTGGPGTASCLGNQEQMGEGWSDYYALLLTDTNTETRGIGTYVLFEPTSGQGIRTFPYTRNMGINPSTYDFVKILSIPHGVGSVWATMLWDMTRDLVDRHGFDADIYFGSGGNNLSIQLVTEGMKLQPCFPGFVDGRDAILAADVAYTGGLNQCLIWDAFADRGLGVSASQGSPFSVADGTQAFDNPAFCSATFATLAGLVNDLRSGGFLNGGQANSLLKKLDAAERQANAGQGQTAANILFAFINEVQDLVANGILTPLQGQDLIAQARALIEGILYP